MKMWNNLKIFNNIEKSKFSGIVCRICFAISAKKAFIFTKDEFVKLHSSVQIPCDQLEDILNQLKIVLFESGENAFESSELQEKLLNSELEESHVKILNDHYLKNRDDIILSVQQLSFAEWQMKSVAWELHAEVASTNTARQKYPIAIMNLSLYKPTSLPNITQIDSAEERSKNTAKEITFQMDYEQLLKLYTNLEQIQDEIDNLG